MSLELNLRFSGVDQVEVRIDGEESGLLPFSNPLTQKDRDDLRWYLETYGAYSLGDPDDEQARDVKNRLPLIGKALFDSVFSDRATQRLFDRFQDADDTDRQLTIAGENAEVLSLPWELLHDSASGGAFLFRERPVVSIRRRLAGATGGRKSFKVETKDTLRLLFVVSRPEDAGFLDPRADPGAVMDALEAEAPGRVVCEFLRPATIDALTARLDDEDKPPIDIVHFDGHGVFDADGRVEDPSRKVADSEDVRDRTREANDGGADDDNSVPTGMGYLLFEDEDGQRHLVSAQDVGQNLHRSRVSLVILSACQSAMVGDGADPLAMVAARLTAAGIPAVLAMTHSVLVHTTRTLFGEFYKHLARGGRIGESLDRARALLQNHPQKYDVQRGSKRKKLELHDWFVPALYQSGNDVPLLRKYEVPPLTGDRGPTVFLSHSSVDKPAARRLADSLTMHGIEVWLDEGEIKVGDPISGKISDGLEKCDYLVVLLSQNSVESEWVQREINSRLHSDAANARHSILPVQLDDCEIPPLLVDLLRADLRENHAAAVNSLVQAITETRRLEQATRSSGTTQDAPDPAESPNTVSGRLRPEHEAGFFGRRHELWDIECWFAGPTERISITGFGGQGKTELALEAGRWLTRTGQFQQAVFVDYSQIQADAPDSVVRVAVSHIGSVLDRSMTDVQDATSALRDTPTLVILDNLEVLSPESLQALLDATVQWSRAGGSRVLLTSRTPEFDHPDYSTAGTFKHRQINLTGLGDKSRPDDALEWFAELSKLPPAPDSGIKPPTRDELIELFDQVRFHPLSIAVLAQQLKSRKVGELGQRLEQLLTSEPCRLEQAPRSSGSKDEPLPEQRSARSSLQSHDDTPAPLLASLLLSLDRLTDDERQAVRALGVFQGGAFEDDLLAITGLGKADTSEQRAQLQTILTAIESRDARAILPLFGTEIPDGVEIPEEVLAQLPWGDVEAKAGELRKQLAELPETPSQNVWPELRRQLERAALIEAERVPGVRPPFLRFHPTLAPLLWSQLDAAEQSRLTDAHRQRYYQLSGYLYHKDKTNPHHVRAIAWRELPNLLHAVHNAMAAVVPHAVEFTSNVTRFATMFGLAREAQILTTRADKLACNASSQDWFMARSNRGEEMFASGQVEAAADLFTEILATLDDSPSYNRSLTLCRLGRCYQDSGRPDLAEATHRSAIAVTSQLQPSHDVKRQLAIVNLDLADALSTQGQFSAAREKYELGLGIATELNDTRQMGVAIGQLGLLAIFEGDLIEAHTRYLDALELFQRLREPTMEALYWHQLGLVFQKARKWDEAERHYREAARIREANDKLVEAAQTWNQLAIVSEEAGRSEVAETWLRKAIQSFRAIGDLASLSKSLGNLATLLKSQAHTLSEARVVAEETLAITRNLDPNASQIWKTYNILAEIADQQSREDEAAEYRRLARDAKRNFAGTRHQMQQFASVILTFVSAIAGDENAIKSIPQFLDMFRSIGEQGVRCADAFEKLLAGERDVEVLCAGINLDLAMFIETILAGLADPSTLADLLPPDAAPDD